MRSNTLNEGGTGSSDNLRENVESGVMKKLHEFQTKNVEDMEREWAKMKFEYDMKLKEIALRAEERRMQFDGNREKREQTYSDLQVKREKLFIEQETRREEDERERNAIRLARDKAESQFFLAMFGLILAGAMLQFRKGGASAGERRNYEDAKKELLRARDRIEDVRKKPVIDPVSAKTVQDTMQHSIIVVLEKEVPQKEKREKLAKGLVIKVDTNTGIVTVQFPKALQNVIQRLDGKYVEKLSKVVLKEKEEGGEKICFQEFQPGDRWAEEKLHEVLALLRPKAA